MTRRDYFHQADAPAANSLRPAASVALLDEAGHVLLLRRRDNEFWTLPGGTMELNESLTDCAVREVREETGYEIEVTALVGTYTDPKVIVAYADGEVRREFTIVYLGKIRGGTRQIDAESHEARWVPLSEAGGLPMARSQQRRVADLLVFMTERTPFLR